MVALAGRLALIALVPQNFSFDGYQRWAGREHLLVRAWLPLTQAVVWLVAQLGGGIIAVRVVLAVVASLGMAGGARVAGELGGREAAWLFLPVTLFGPLLVWTSVPYQEGVYLALLLWGIALGLAARRRGEAAGARLWLAADLLIGALALTRYEGWVAVALWLVWRRDRRAILALWGAALWLAVHVGLGATGYEPSPVSYADWQGLFDRFTVEQYRSAVRRGARQALASGGADLAAVGAVGALVALRLRRPASLLISMLIVVQLAITAFWLAGLETSLHRMQAVPGALLGLFAATLAAWGWRRGATAVRGFMVVVAVLITGMLASDGLRHARDAVRHARWEADLAAEIAACDDCRYQVIPRMEFGPQDRHDGCEIIQGITELRTPEDFLCEPWPDPLTERPTHVVRWTRRGYVTIPMKR